MLSYTLINSLFDVSGVLYEFDGNYCIYRFDDSCQLFSAMGQLDNNGYTYTVDTTKMTIDVHTQLETINIMSKLLPHLLRCQVSLHCSATEILVERTVTNKYKFMAFYNYLKIIGFNCIELDYYNNSFIIVP